MSHPSLTSQHADSWRSRWGYTANQAHSPPPSGLRGTGMGRWTRPQASPTTSSAIFRWPSHCARRHGSQKSHRHTLRHGQLVTFGLCTGALPCHLVSNPQRERRLWVASAVRRQQNPLSARLQLRALKRSVPDTQRNHLPSQLPTSAPSPTHTRVPSSSIPKPKRLLLPWQLH